MRAENDPSKQTNEKEKKTDGSRTFKAKSDMASK
jgi:hypothetical protein